MSRSLHTQKLEIRAERRLARPYSARRDEAAYLAGHSVGRKTDAVQALPRPLRIEVQKPLPGLRHALTSEDIRDCIVRLGPASSYGLRAIRLRSQCAVRPEGIVFAEYIVPGEIQIFAVPERPWRLSFQVGDHDRRTFERYGVHLEVGYAGITTMVHGSVEEWKRFYLREVLVHELGHHRLQFPFGKRTVVRCRRRDHETRADLESRRATQLLDAYEEDI